jgi:hypothetical protein
MSVLTKSLGLLSPSLYQNSGYKSKKGVGCEFRPVFSMTKFIHNFSAAPARRPVNVIRCLVT